MSGLKRILQKAEDEKLRGGSVSAATIRKLSAYRKRQFWIFVAVETVVVIAVGFCAYLLAETNLDAARVKILTGVIGIGAGGGLEVGRRIWKEWAQTDLLLLLLSEASEAQVNSTIDKLLKKL